MRAGLVIVVLALAGCGGGSGDGLDQNGQPLSTGGGVPLAPTLASIQGNVFSVNCAVSGCHGGASVQQNLNLDPGFSAANLINVVSSQDATLIRVIPGNPGGSLLIQKLEGTQTVGFRMPSGGPFLPQATIDVIRQWIQIGAPP